MDKVEIVTDDLGVVTSIKINGQELTNCTYFGVYAEVREPVTVQLQFDAAALELTGGAEVEIITDPDED